jgi:transcription antitermination factor NusB
MKLSFKKRRFLIQALYQFHIKHEKSRLELKDQTEIDSNIINKKAIINLLKDTVSLKKDGDVIEKNEELTEELAPIFLHILRTQQELRKNIEQYLSELWTWNRIPIVVRSILYAATYELLSNQEQQYKKVIVDYLEIAKNFNHQQELKFINAVLDKVRQNQLPLSQPNN